MISDSIKEICNAFIIGFSNRSNSIDVATAWQLSSSQLHVLEKGVDDVRRNTFNIQSYDYEKYLFHYMVYGTSCYDEYNSSSNDTNSIFWLRILSGAMMIYDYQHRNDNRFVDALISLQSFISNHNTTDNNDTAIATISINDNDTYSIISIYALGLIQLYDGKCNNTISEALPIHLFITSCLNNIKLSITTNSNDKDDLNDSALLSIHILQTLFSKGQHMNSMMSIIESHIIDYIDILLSILSLTPSSREKITKKILNTLTSLLWPLTPSTTSTVTLNKSDVYIDRIWTFCLSVTKDVSKNTVLAVVEDLNIVTILLCMLLNSSMNAINQFTKLKTFWVVICNCFLHSDMVIRKRAAFILQHLVPKIDKKDKTPKPWYVDYLTVYNQIEGCVSEHLLSQIWPIFDALCLQVASKNVESCVDNDGYPTLSFQWIKGLINCILFQTHPQIRRLILYRVFTSITAIPYSVATVDWLCYDLLSNHLDNVLYFSSNYIGREIDVGCSQAIQDAIEQKAGSKFGVLKNCTDNKNETNGSVIINAYSRPGVLLPYFISRFMKTIHLQVESEHITVHLMKSLLKVVCSDPGMKSTSAIKWIFRTFSESIVLDMVPIFIGLAELHTIKRFFFNYVATCNAKMKEQMLQSLLPLLLKGYDVKQLGLSPLLRIIVRNIGLKRIISDKYICNLLADVIRRGALKSNDDSILSCNFDISDESDWDLVFIVRSLLVVEDDRNDMFDGNLAIEKWDQLIDDKMKLCANLYLNPYIPSSHQLEAFWFTHGAASLFTILYDLYNINCDSRERYRRMMITFIDKFIPIVSDLVSYFSISINASLASIPTNLKEKLSFSMLTSVSVVNEVDLLDAASEVLIGLMIMPKISTLKVDEGYLAALAILMTFLNDCISAKAPDVSDASSDLLCTLVDIKKTLAIRCSAQLLAGFFLRVFPHNTQDLDSIERLLDLSADLTFTVFRAESPKSHAYRSTLDYLSSRRPIELKENEKLSVHYNFLDQCNQFSFMSIMFLDNKWLLLKSGMQIIGADAARRRTALTSSSHIEDILSLAMDQLSICSESGLPYLLGCCKAAIGALLPIPSNFDVKIIETVPFQTIRIIENLLSLSCNVTLHDGMGYIDMKIISALIELVFDMHVLFYINFDIVSDHYQRLFQIGLQNRPHLIQCLVNHLSTVWMTYHYFSIPFFDQIKKLLIYKEQKKDDNNTPEYFNDAYTSCRIMLLTFLESASIKISTGAGIKNDIDLKFISCIRQLIVDFVNMSLRKEYTVQAIIGTELFGEKLRSWQALCIVSNLITEDIVVDIADKYFLILSHVCAHAIRVHMEIFGSVMLSKFPHLILPKLFQELKCFNHSQQKLSSLFVIIAHFIEYSKGDDQILTVQLAQDIIDHVMPWLSCAAGLPRSIGQLILTVLVPMVINDTEELSLGHTYLRNILSYLEYNKDAQKMIPRQRAFFKEFSIANLCSVKGLNKIKLDNGGEIVPDHMLDLIMEVLRENAYYENNKVDSFAPLDYPITASNEIALQTKRISFDQLQLRLENELLSRRLNSSGRNKQQVIMCAALVEKATNIAGIARTCEIFAVEELIISDLRVMQSDDFKGISVNAGDWLQIKEVSSSNLVPYLISMKTQGYVIVGLEQTDSSMSMLTSTLPNKCVLLLGKEKEGIPVELLQLVDICIEIPQFGVTRSLNVHVSAALLLWEVTKQNKEWLK